MTKAQLHEGILFNMERYAQEKVHGSYLLWGEWNGYWQPLIAVQFYPLTLATSAQ